MIWLKSIKSSLPLITIICLSAFIIFFKFPFIPQNLAFDEVEFARLALALKNTSYIPYIPLATGHTTLYFYVILAFFNLFGVNTFALRLSSAIFGVLCSVMFYLVMKEIFKTKKIQRLSTFIPFLLTLIFISLRWFFQFARFSFEATFLLFLELVSLYFIFKFLHHKNKWFIILSGLFAGLAYNSYTPGRIFFFVPIFALFVKEFQWNIFSKKNILTLGCFLVPFVLTILPLNLYLSQNKEERVQDQLYFANKNISPENKVVYFFSNVYVNALSFNIKGDANGRHNYPLKPSLNPILGLFFIAGLIITIKNIRNFYNKIFLIYLLISFIPTLLTSPAENPHMLRTMTAVPAVVYIIGNAIHSLLQKKLNKKIIVALCTLILISSFYELRTYFGYQTQVFPKAFEIKGSLIENVHK